MPFNQGLYFLQELIENGWLRRDNVRLVAVASGKILRCDDTHLVPLLGLNEQYLGMVVCEMGGRNHLFNKAPQMQRLICGLEVQYQVNSRSRTATSDEVQTAQELLADGEGCLPDLRCPHLFQHPFENIRNLHLISKSRLHGHF